MNGMLENQTDAKNNFNDSKTLEFIKINKPVSCWQKCVNFNSFYFD